MDIIKQYRLFCETENAHVETWKMTKPECCPNDYRHTIDPSSVSVIGERYVESGNIQNVYISSKAYYPTNGKYCAEGLSYNIPADTSTFVEHYTFMKQCCMYGMHLCVREDHIGDRVSIIVQPETIAGVLTSTALTTDTVLHVSNTVVQHVIPGYYVVLGEEERLIVEVDKSGNTITIDTPFDSVHNGMELVKINVYVIRNLCLDTVCKFDIGYGAFGGKLIPKNSLLRMVYHKLDPASSKRFCLNMEYMY
jgi:hypothetical protein